MGHAREEGGSCVETDCNFTEDAWDYMQGKRSSSYIFVITSCRAQEICMSSKCMGSSCLHFVSIIPHHPTPSHTILHHPT